MRCIEVIKSRYIGTIILSVTNCELPKLCHYTYLTATGLPVCALSFILVRGPRWTRHPCVFNSRRDRYRQVPPSLGRGSRWLGWKVTCFRFIFSRRGLHGLHPILGRRVQSYPSFSILANQNIENDYSSKERDWKMTVYMSWLNAVTVHRYFTGIGLTELWPRRQLTVDLSYRLLHELTLL